MDNMTGSPTTGPLPVASPQFALLDFLVPGFSFFSSAVQTYLGINLNIYIPLLLVVFGATFAWNYLSEFAWGVMEGHLMSSVTIRTDDEIYNMIMMWIARQKFAQRSRRFIVNTNINSRSWFLWRSFEDDEDEDNGDGNGDSNNTGRKKKALQYTPSFGTHFFWYNNNLLLFERHENREQSSALIVSEREELSIKCFGRNPAIIKRLLLEARDQYMAKDDKKTLIYRGASSNTGGDPTWQRCMARSSRPFSTVILNEKIKKDLIDDVTDYLNPETRRWYSNRGIPYRRGYLLYGPPGTGKSSLSLALAGFFQMKIYIVSLSSIMANEENLSTLFAELPRRCVVLLEDIDSAGLTHTREENGATTEVGLQAAPASPVKPKANEVPLISNRLSLSGLLNILDGVASQEGRVLIMTTNHLEKLDKALIRPGRVDMVVKFGLADADMTAAIFRAIYAPYQGEVQPGQDAFEGIETAAEMAKRQEQERQDETARVNVLAAKFAAKIPEHEFSPAEIQGLLLRHKREPEGVLDHIDEWVVQTRKDKKQKEIEDAEKRRKDEEKQKKKDAKAKRKEERRKARKKKAKAEKRKNGEDTGDDDSDSDSSSSEDEATEKKPEPAADKPADNTETKDASPEEVKSADEKKDTTEDAKIEAKNEKKEEEAEPAEEKKAAPQAAEDDKKSPSDSGYDT